MDLDPDPDADLDPAIFVSDLQDVNKNFFAYYFLKIHLHHFSKKPQKSRNQCFSYYFA
jgi:hypothetical protein